MRKISKIIISFLIVSTFITSVLTIPVFAMEAINTAKDDGYQAIGEGLGYDTSKSASVQMPAIRDKIIQSLLGFLGIFFLILIIIGGYQWMTAGGNDEVIAKAKKRIINAVIGLTIVLAAYIITIFITEILFKNTVQEIPPPPAGE